MTKAPPFSQDDLKSWLRYDPATGLWTWLVAMSRRCKIGGIAGSLGDQGYWVIRLNGRLYKAHRLAWFYMKGEWPSDDIDHENTIRLDGRWSNLRKANKAQTCQNRSNRSDNTAGIKGVSWHRRIGRWQAQIQIAGKKKFLGYYEIKAEAGLAYAVAAHASFGRFARTT
jgi:hypothetical protein